SAALWYCYSSTKAPLVKTPSAQQAALSQTASRSVTQPPCHRSARRGGAPGRYPVHRAWTET
ncbi:MAG TPA: hypothetical protein VLL08_13015, partial [Kineosporiaceae bacterium]|nr:hypothetical protein [Kineosporiaceae bacterium]